MSRTSTQAATPLCKEPEDLWPDQQGVICVLAKECSSTGDLVGRLIKYAFSSSAETRRHPRQGCPQGVATTPLLTSSSFPTSWSMVLLLKCFLLFEDALIEHKVWLSFVNIIILIGQQLETKPHNSESSV